MSRSMTNPTQSCDVFSSFFFQVNFDGIVDEEVDVDKDEKVCLEILP